MTETKYSAESIQVLSGLEPVRRRPGMYTDTSRPNHLVQEVVDNSVDEALAGHAHEIRVELFEDGSVDVIDDGRGMPVDIHPEFKVSGVELILTRLHSGGKFDNETYAFSGGLHGVGVSVVNALSSWLEVEVRRDGTVYRQRYENGAPKTKLKAVDSVGKRNTGTRVRFLPDPSYFDTTQVAIGRLRHLLRAKAVLCPGLRVSLTVHRSGKAESEEWLYEDGLAGYLLQEIDGADMIPAQPFCYGAQGNKEAVDWALAWIVDGGELVAESYVNLIPTPLGGTHVNGLRSGLAEAMKEFCEFRDLLPRGLKLTGDDLWDQLSYVLSAKLAEPQFSGQTKERLSSRQSAAFISGVAKDAFSLWLNEHPADGTRIAEIAIRNAQQRAQAARKVERKKITAGPALPGKLADCSVQDSSRSELFLVEGDSAGGSAKQARNREFQAVMPLRGKILNTWEVSSSEILASAEVHDISVALGVDPASSDLSALRYDKVCILADADSDGSHIATLLCALSSTLPCAGRCGSRLHRDAAVVSDRRRQGRLLRARRSGKGRHPRSDRGRKETRQRQRAAIQRPGRDEPDAAARNDDGSGHAPAGAADAAVGRRYRRDHGHDARQEARRRSARVAGKEGRSGNDRLADVHDTFAEPAGRQNYGDAG